MEKIKSDSKKLLKHLLVMPRLIQNIGDGYSFPLGIAYISASMKKAGHDVTTLNLNHFAGDASKIITDIIREKNIDVVATGGLSFQYGTVRQVVEAAKKACEKVVTIVGGGIITGDPEPAMEALQYADYGVIGEGETTINELCEAIENRRELSDVNGIIYKTGNSFVRNKPRVEIKDIDFLPFPDYEGFEIEKYLQSAPPGISGLNVGKTVFMLASRSCPYNCTFCFHSAGKKYRQRSLNNFFDELDHMVAKYDIEFVCMADELFARDIKRVKEFCDRIRKYNINWWAQFRVDDITPEIIAIIKEGGCRVMSFGLESADNRILKSMRKGTTVEQIERTLKLVYDAGISFEGAFIFGDIAETYETASNTLKWWREHSEYRITLNLITVYPGTYLYKYACEKGIITDRVKFLKLGCPQVNVSKLSDSEMTELLGNFMEAPIAATKVVASPEITKIDYASGRLGMSGKCIVCGKVNEWDNIKLFTMNFIPCAKCGQKYNVPLFPELRKNIENNIGKLLKRFGKLAIWGINYHSSNLFKNSVILRSDSVFPVDSSESKRKMDLYGRTINPPDIIDKEGISAVIVAVPVYLTQIQSQIEANHRNVKSVIDICKLTDPDFMDGFAKSRKE